MTTEKQSLPVFINEDGDPVALIYFNKNRERIIYTVTKAGEDEIIAILENKDLKIKSDETGN